MDNLIGQSLGRYHILEQLGEGGMAIVYKANVDWNQANTYCQWHGARLPTEAEYESGKSPYGIYDLAGNVDEPAFWFDNYGFRCSRSP